MIRTLRNFICIFIFLSIITTFFLHIHLMVDYENDIPNVDVKVYTSKGSSKSKFSGHVEQEHVLLCSESGNKLVGPLAVTFETPSYEQLATIHPDLKPGGMFEPDFCIPRARVAIIVPYRNRDEQLRAFLHHMHPILQRQLLKYEIFVVEQFGESIFNKALLMNIGFNESIQLAEWDYFIFHDVDLFLEDDRVPHQCPNGPVHLAAYIDKVYYHIVCPNLKFYLFQFKYKLFYKSLFGGAVCLSKFHFKSLNGFSNMQVNLLAC